jgi:hypothetical protein
VEMSVTLFTRFAHGSAHIKLIYFVKKLYL